MNSKVHYLIALCCSVVLLSMTGQAALAQDPDTGEQLVPEVVVSPSGRLDLTFDQIGRGTRQINGHGAGQTYPILIPGNFQILPGSF